MSKINVGPIFLSEFTFQYVADIKNRTKAKNYSETINQMLSRYSDILEQVQVLRQKLQEKTKENSELHDIIRKYRDKIIDDDLTSSGDKGEDINVL